MSDTGASMEDDIEAPKVKKRRVKKDDWSKIEAFIKGELEKRRDSKFRKSHEEKWKEVDRQIKMEPLMKIPAAGSPTEWYSALELGELSKASEIICADVRRITFPQDRFWLEAHVEIPLQVHPQTGQAVAPDPKKQTEVDGTLRSFMTQQHLDFGFKSRVDLSIKEALHHGSFVAEIEWQEQQMFYDGKDIKTIGAPVWVPHSMWNCYPDESPSVEPTANFYTGAMIIRKFQPLYRVKQFSGEGWMPAQYAKIKRQEHKNGDIETQDVELIYYYGDINIARADGDMYLPNSKAITANGTIVYWAPNALPFPNIVYSGYERQDPRDPYYTSPLIKQSPTQKIASICANEYLDALRLRVKPPIVYDGNDPYFVQNDGPVLEPGSKTASKGSTDFKIIEIGDPAAALAGLEMTLRQMQEGTGVSAVRSGIANSDRQTATEVQKVAQGAEVRTIDFIDKLNANLRSYLYMQHQLNLKHCENYSFYNSEMGTADFIRLTKKDIPENVHFDVVGSKGLLGEEQRANRTANVVAFASGNPMFAPILKPAEILTEMFQDAGNKNPERFLQQEQPQIPPQVQMKMQQLEQALQECQMQLQDAEKKLGDKSQQMQLDAAKAQQDMQQGAQKHQQDMTIDAQQSAQDLHQDRLKFVLDMKQKEAAARQKLQQRPQ